MIGNVLVILFQFVHFSLCGNEKSQNWKLVENWPKYNNFGQISGVSVDTHGNIYVFHRGNRVWDSNSFYDNNTFRNSIEGPIKNQTIIILDPVHGEAKKKTGAGKFFMPHGLTVDGMNNVWITDVALHQVFKFPPITNNGLLYPEIELGHRFEPGNDKEHFCKPTDVAVDQLTGDFYVADGYCNSRIIKYDKYGNILLIWGRSSYMGMSSPYILNVPHAFSLSSDYLFVADRENFRALAFSIKTGNFKQSFPEKRRIYSVAYSSGEGKYLFTLSNSSYISKGVVSVYNLESGEVVQTFAPPNGFSNPHDIALSSDGKLCYVVELSPNKVWKFRLDLNEDGNEVKFINSDTLMVKNKSDHDFLGGTMLAIGVVSFVIFIIFLIFAFHIHKKKAGYAQYEMRRLILDDEEEVSINAS